MKVICTNCGKRFQYELYSGICPHCGTYVRQESDWDDMTLEDAHYEAFEQSVSEETEDWQEEAETSEFVNEPEAVFTDAETDDNWEEEMQTISNATHSFRSNRVLTFILVLLIAGSVALPFLYHTFITPQKKASLLVEDSVSPEECTASEGVVVATENGDFTITFSGATKDSDPAFETPDGYEFVAVSYHVALPEQVLENSPGQPDDNFLYTNWESGSILTYCITKSGSYLTPISGYDIGDVKGLDYDGREEHGISDEISFQDGTLYFLVKEGDFDGLLLNEIDPDTEILKQSYVVTDVPYSDEP